MKDDRNSFRSQRGFAYNVSKLAGAKAEKDLASGIRAFLLTRARRIIYASLHNVKLPGESKMRLGYRPLVVALLVCTLVHVGFAQTAARVSEMRAAIERYTADRGSLTRSYPVTISPARRARFKKFYEEWLASLKPLDFDSMSQDGKIDYLLFKNHLEYELRQLELQTQQLADVQPLVPFANTIIDLEEARRRMEPINSGKVAATLTELKKQVDERKRAVDGGVQVKKTVANRAIATMTLLRTSLRNWYAFYNGYDPLFTWWNEEPYKSLDQSLTTYETSIKERLLGQRSEAGRTQTGATQGQGSPGSSNSRSNTARPGDASDIVGDPIGREALLVE